MPLFSKALRFLFIFILYFLFCDSTAYGQQAKISFKNEEQLHQTIDTIGNSGKDASLLLQLFRYSEEKEYFNAQYDISYKLGFYYFANANRDSALYYFNTSEYLYKTHTLKDKKIEKTYMDMGVLLVDMGLINKAINSFNKSYELCLASGNIDKAVLAKMNIASCYSDLKDFDKSIILIKEVLNDLTTTNPTYTIGCYNVLSLSYNELENYDEAISWVNKAITIADSISNPYISSSLYTNLGLFYSGKKEYKKALENGFKGMKLSDSIGSYRNKNSRYGRIGGYYLGLKDYDKAKEYLSKAMQGSSNYESLQGVYEDFIELYEQQNEPKKMITTYEKYVTLMDSVSEAKDKDYITTIDKQRELIEQEYKNKELIVENELVTEKNSKQELFIIGLSIIVFISLVALYLLFKDRKNKQVIAELKVKEKLLLEQQIRLRDNELDATAIAISQRVETLNTIKTALETIKDTNPKLDGVNNTIKNLITSASDLTVVTDRIESQYPTAAAELRIKHPALSENEIRYCLLTKLNLSIKETATMLNVAPNTVKVTKSRIKKKMDIPLEISLKEYLDKIYIRASVA